MTLSSMTGFARSHGTSGPYAFDWELKSVNAKGFDFRMRLPPGFDEIEQRARKEAAGRLARGTVYANLTVKRTGTAAAVRVNHDVLNAVLKIAVEMAGRIDAVAPSIDGLMSIKGVVEVAEPETDEAEDQEARAAILSAFEQALDSLIDMRRREGADENGCVDAAMAFGQHVRQPSRAVRIDEVEQGPVEFGAGFAERDAGCRDSAFAVFRLARGEIDPVLRRPGARQRRGQSQPDAAGRADDDRDTSVRHGVPPEASMPRLAALGERRKKGPASPPGQVAGEIRSRQKR